MLSSDYNVLSSTVITLNNFTQHSHCQAVKPFRLMPFLIRALTTIISKHIAHPFVRFPQCSCLKFIEARATPFVSFSCWNEFYDCKCYVHRRTKKTYETHAAYRLALIHSLLAVPTDNLSSKLPKQTDQLHYPTSRTSFFDTITSCRKQPLYWNRATLPLAEFFTSPPKFNVDKPT